MTNDIDRNGDAKPEAEESPYFVGYEEPEERSALQQGKRGRLSSTISTATAVLLLLIAAGAALRIYRLGHQSFWVDESISYILAVEDRSPVEHPPLYFRALGVALRLLDSRQEWAVRLLSAVAGTLSIPLIFFLGRAAGDRWTGVAAAFVLAISPYHIQVSQEARMYALLCLFTLAALLCRLAAARASGLRAAIGWLGFSLSLAGAMYTHHMGILLVPATLLPFLTDRRSLRGPLFAWLGAVGLALLLYIPQLPQTVEQFRFRARLIDRATTEEMRIEEEGSRRRMTHQLQQAVRKGVGTLYYLGAGYRYTDLSGDGLKKALSVMPDRALLPLLALVPLLLTLYGFSILLDPEQRDAAILMAGTGAVVLVFGALEGSPANHMTMIIPSYALLMGIGIRGRHARWIAIPAAVLVAGLYAASLSAYYRSETYVFHREDWRGVCAYLEDRSRPGDAIFVHGGRNGYFTVRYYYRGPAEVSCCIPQEQMFSPFFKEELPPFELGPHLEGLMRRHGRVWFIYPDWGSAVRREELVELNRRHLVQAINFGEDLYLFDYTLNRQ